MIFKNVIFSFILVLNAVDAFGVHKTKNKPSGKPVPEEPKASSAWKSPKVFKNTAGKVLYLPIAHPEVLEVPIKENKEDLVDLKEFDPRICALSVIEPAYQEPYPDYSKVRACVADALKKMLSFLPTDVGIAYEEGYRPLWKQEEYFTNKLKEIYAAQKRKNIKKAYHETSTHVSPFINTVPPHCTGAAIDMTLFSIKDKTLLDMGKLDTVFGPNDQEETFSQNTTTVQRKNRLLLLNAATKAGLVNYGYEWWHYSFGDRAWAYVTHQSSALYEVAEKQNSSSHQTVTEYLKAIEKELKNSPRLACPAKADSEDEKP